MTNIPVALHIPATMAIELLHWHSFCDSLISGQNYLAFEARRQRNKGDASWKKLENLFERHILDIHRDRAQEIEA